MTEETFYELDEITRQEVEDLKKRPVHKILIIPKIEELEAINIEENFEKYGRFLIFLSNYMKYYNPARPYDEEEKATERYIKEIIYKNISF